MANVSIKKLAAAGIALAVVVVVLGAFTRLVDAGLGCPDWPGCYGHLTWPTQAQEIAAAEKKFPASPVEVDKAWPEMVHRYAAGSLLLLVFGLVVMSWRAYQRGEVGRDTRTLTSALLVLIICQAAFGAWTVTLKLWPQVVTAHLMGGFATLSMLWVIYLRHGGLPSLRMSTPQLPGLRRHMQLALGVVIAQIMLGGWVSSNYAALACPYFPACVDSYWPSMDMAAGFNIFQDVGPNYLGGLLDNEARVAIHWTHRLGALVVLLVVAALCLRLWSFNRRLSALLGGLLFVQLTLGVLNIVWTLPLAVATAHNAVGALLLLAVVAVNFAPRTSPAHSVPSASMPGRFERPVTQ